MKKLLAPAKKAGKIITTHTDGDLKKEGGGYILGSSTSIFKGISPENYRAMVNAAIEYGKYIREISYKKSREK